MEAMDLKRAFYSAVTVAALTTALYTPAYSASGGCLYVRNGGEDTVCICGCNPSECKPCVDV